MPKYNLCSLYNDTYMYVSRADHLVTAFRFGMLFPAEDYFSRSLHACIDYSSLCKAESLYLFLHPNYNVYCCS